MEAYYSTSIANWKKKFERKFKFKDWSVFRPFVSVAFFGLYNYVDYLKFLWHRGEKTVLWCGSDILNLSQRRFWLGLLKGFGISSARNICENETERMALSAMGIESEKKPCLVDNIDVEVSYKYSKNPHVYLCAHEGRENEYGLSIINGLARIFTDYTFHIYGVNEPRSSLEDFWYENVIYHGKVPDYRFNHEIKNYQAALRLNEFDGFSEILARSVLMGQWPISRIAYPHIAHAPGIKSLYGALYALKEKKEPNYEGRAYWKKELSKTL